MTSPDVAKDYHRSINLIKNDCLNVTLSKSLLNNLLHMKINYLL